MTTPTVLAHLNDDPTQPFCFEHNGMAIYNPTLSDCGRFFTLPDAYGFAIYETGGGCTAWRRNFVLPDGRPCYMMITAGDDALHVTDPTDVVTIGVYVDKDYDYDGWVTYNIDDSNDPPRMINVAREGEEI